MGILIRLIGAALLIQGLASNEGTIGQLLLLVGGLILLFPFYRRPARRHAATGIPS
jgi:hypothetical protein